jgi:hypothetical protein
MPDHVLILEPLSSGSRLPAAAGALGARVSVLALDAGTVRLDDACRPWIDTLIPFNVSDTAAVLRAAEQLDASHPITAVIPGFEYFVPLAHRLAAWFGLPHNDILHIDALRHKDVMAARAREAGLRIPRTHVVADVAQALAAGEDVGYPAVVKAPDTAASCDVYKVRDARELLERCDRIWRRPPEEDWEYPVADFALVQEFVTGPEISIETVTFGAGPALVNITDKLVTDGPNFVELGHAVPSALGPGELALVRRFAEKAHAAYGIRVGAAHIEPGSPGTGSSTSSSWRPASTWPGRRCGPSSAHTGPSGSWTTWPARASGSSRPPPLVGSGSTAPRRRGRPRTWSCRRRSTRPASCGTTATGTGTWSSAPSRRPRRSGARTRASTWSPSPPFWRCHERACHDFCVSQR